MQDAMGQLVAYVVQNTGMDENQVTQRLQQILSDNTSKAKLANILQRMQQQDTSAEQELISLFKPSFKQGGKIHDFICKHARGGSVDCGCNKSGGNIEMDRRGKTVATYTDKNTYGKRKADGTTVINGSYPTFSQEMTSGPKGTIYREWNDGDMFPSVSVVDSTWWANHPVRAWMSRNLGIGPTLMTGNESVVTNMNEAKDNHENAWTEKKQRGGYLIPSLRYRSLGDWSTENETNSGRVGQVWGEGLNVDGTSVFVPNRQMSGKLIFGNNGNEVLIEGTGYNNGEQVLNPVQVRAIRKEGMIDTARVQNENGLVKTEQEGGELTRREALRLGQENKRYNRGQARFAYQNAKQALRNNNATIENPEERLRGRALRQRAREMVAGRVPSEQTAYVSTSQPWWKSVPSTEIPVELSTLNSITPEEQAYIDNTFEQSIIRPYLGNFNQAFGNARRDGRGLFIWNKEPYTTELDSTETPEQLLKRAQNNLTGVDIAIEVPASDENYIKLNENLFDKVINGEMTPREYKGELLRRKMNKLFVNSDQTVPDSGLVFRNGGNIKKKDNTVVKGQLGMGGMPVLPQAIRRAYNNYKDSKVGKAVGNFLNGEDMDLSNEEYTAKHGYGKPVGSLGPAAYITPAGVGKGLSTVGKVASRGKLAKVHEAPLKPESYIDDAGNIINVDKTHGLGAKYNKRTTYDVPEPELNNFDFPEPDFSSIDFNNLTTNSFPWEEIGIGASGAATGYAIADAIKSRKNKNSTATNQQEVKENKTGGKVNKGQFGITVPSDTTTVKYSFHPLLTYPMTETPIFNSSLDKEHISWIGEDGLQHYAAMPIDRDGTFMYSARNKIGIPVQFDVNQKNPYRMSWNSFFTKNGAKKYYPVDKNTYNKIDSTIVANRSENAKKQIEKRNNKKK